MNSYEFLKHDHSNESYFQVCFSMFYKMKFGSYFFSLDLIIGVKRLGKENNVTLTSFSSTEA